MASYKTNKGFAVQTLATNPVPSIGAWASGGSLNVKRKGIQGFGIQTAAIAVGGQGGPNNTAQTLCESYNGNSWTEVNDVNTGKTTRGNCGVQTAGLLIGGAPATTDTEEWDGTSWTETANYPQSIVDPFLCGVQTAAFCISGGEPFVAATNTYNGSSFTSSTAINTARNAGGAAGSTTAAVIAGGNTNPGAVALTELWNGSSWTEVGDLNTARNLLNSSGTTNTAMLVFGGNPNQARTEQWNGSSWTEIADMATGRQEAGGTTNGSTSLAAIWGGSISGTSQTITEEWTNYSSDTSQTHQNLGQVYYDSGANAFKVTRTVLGTGAWSSGGNLNTARSSGGLAGSISAGLYFGGNTPPSSQLSEEYNGTSWAEGNDMTETARDQMYAFGTQTAAISASGVTGVNGAKSKLVELYDGTSWTAGTDNNTARQAGASAGKAQTAGIMYGGNTGSHSATTESWNGSSWTELNDLNTAGSYIAGGGSQTSALCGVGGGRPAQNESWNGTSWSEIAEQNTFRDQSGGAADNNVSGLIYGGEAPPYTAKTESWDGTTWTEVADLATATGIGSGGTGGQSGGALSALAVGGQAGPGARVATTQEWNVPSSVLNQTITVG